MNNLACFLHKRGRLPDAEKLFREALAGRYSVLGAAHPHTQSTFNRLFALLTSQGKTRDARELQKAHLEKGGK